MDAMVKWDMVISAICKEDPQIEIVAGVGIAMTGSINDYPRIPDIFPSAM